MRLLSAPLPFVEASEGKMEMTFVLRLSCLLMHSMMLEVLRRRWTSGGQSMMVRHSSNQSAGLYCLSALKTDKAF